MDKMELSKSDNQLFGKIADLLNESRKFVVKSVNQTIVLTYFEVGRLIVEDEQQGKERAEYGKSVLKELSQKLTTRKQNQVSAKIESKLVRNKKIKPSR